MDSLLIRCGFILVFDTKISFLDWYDKSFYLNYENICAKTGKLYCLIMTVSPD